MSRYLDSYMAPWRSAADWGFACGAYPADRLDEATMTLCRRIARLPTSCSS